MIANSTIDPTWYFEPLGPDEFTPSKYVGGAWNTSEQHIAPMFGLLTHLIEQERARRGRLDLTISRLSFDIYGPVAMAPFKVSMEVIRPGKTIELIETRVTQGGRTAVAGRAWLLIAGDTTSIAGTLLAPMPAPDTLPPWEYANDWAGEFVRSFEARRQQHSPGRCIIWIRTTLDLLKGATVSPTARLMGIVDVANGASPRQSPNAVAFPNLDLTAHLFRTPVGPWVGLDTSVSFGATGVGLTHSVIHDERGPVGVVSQCLTVRPMDNTQRK
jgi:hypothetical protein